MSQRDLNTGSAPRRQSGAEQRGVGQGGHLLHTTPTSPWGHSSAPGREQHQASAATPAQKELCPPPSHSDTGTGSPRGCSQPNSPYCYGGSSRAAGRNSTVRCCRRGDEDVSNSPSGGALLCPRGRKQRAALSCLPSCDPGVTQGGRRAVLRPAGNALSARGSRGRGCRNPLCPRQQGLGALGELDEHAATPSPPRPPPCSEASCVGWPAPGR